MRFRPPEKLPTSGCSPPGTVFGFGGRLLSASLFAPPRGVSRRLSSILRAATSRSLHPPFQGRGWFRTTGLVSGLYKCTDPEYDDLGYVMKNHKLVYVFACLGGLVFLEAFLFAPLRLRKSGRDAYYCSLNLLAVHGFIQQYMHDKITENVPSKELYCVYIPTKSLPTCPAGGTLIWPNVPNDYPKCSIVGHCIPRASVSPLGDR